ncbi:uncharacterized protein LOC110820915 [Carica papaya]|uniref:uncharacterized protein LOC110820915 n=1 Tax=Carica papaya TaxID=3649 RepID=UPI000B8CB78F|nr:uncharacterized protein LOC110820915 [Carica papaya]
MKDQGYIFCDCNMKTPSPSSSHICKLMFILILFLSLPYIFYSLSFLSSSLNLPTQNNNPFRVVSHHSASGNSPSVAQNLEKTTLKHVVFGIGASAKLWDRRKNYIKLWWRPHEMRGFVWLDKPVETDASDDCLLPPRKISGDTSRFEYRNSDGHRSALRISRIVSETLRLGNMEGVRWFVMGDDDTVFVPDNLISVLSKYDHNQFYYIGSSSESHLQNINFSYGMAYGGGGFAISYPLAKALEKMQDRCMQRYPKLYGSDDRIHACMTELGVPLTKQPGFHQFDVYGNVYGLLAAHPIAPLISLHHLDLVDPIFPDVGRVDGLMRLKLPTQLDSAALMQQSICYDKSRNWTVSLSWGYTVQIFRGLIPAREIEMPARTFLDWYMRSDGSGSTFNSRPFSKNRCQTPSVYFLSNAFFSSEINKTGTEYVRFQRSSPSCSWEMENPYLIHRVEVSKKPDPFLWDKPPRRNCCRVLPATKKGTMVVDVGTCQEDETIEL